MDCDVPGFKGARKITSLNCYPLKYHKNEPKLRAELIERGRKFVSLQGVNYKSHEGLAYYKKRKQVIKVNINGRIMVDPAIHRRILPNYNVSTVKPKDSDSLDSDYDDDSDDEGCGCGDRYVFEFNPLCCICLLLCSSDDGQGHGLEEREKRSDDEPKMKLKVVLDEKEQPRVIEVPVDADGQELHVEKLEEVPSKMMKEDGEIEVIVPEEDKKVLPTFTDEEYLISSPVVLGFAFAEKLWLEFTVSGIKDITWNEGAYDSLVLEDNTKAIVKVSKPLCRDKPVLTSLGSCRIPQIPPCRKYRRCNPRQGQGSRCRSAWSTRNRKDTHRRRHLRTSQMSIVYGQCR